MRLKIHDKMFQRRSSQFFERTIVFILCISVGTIDSNENKKKASELLQEAVKYSEFLDKTDAKAREVIADGIAKFDTITKSKIRPAWDKFEGIRNKTEFYEAMKAEDVPKDEEANTFVTFSTTELMIMKTKFFVTQMEYSEVNRKLTEEWDMLTIEITECRNQLQYFVKNEFSDPLAVLQIYIEPTDFQDPARQNKPRPDKNMTTSEIMKIVTSELIPMVQHMEDTKLEDDLPPHFEISDIKNLKLFKFLQDLMHHMEEYDYRYQSVVPQWMQKLKNISETIDVQLWKNLDGTKWRLEEMAIGIEKELPILLERIDKLRDKLPSLYDNEEDDDDSHDEL